MKIVLCSDHAGFELKQSIKEWLKVKYDVIDAGANKYDKNDSYVDYAKKANELVLTNNALGIYVCGSGVGVNIVANRQKGIRSAVCYDENLVNLCRKHNNINVLCLGANYVTFNKAKIIINEFIATKFEGGRHTNRVESIDK